MFEDQTATTRAARRRKELFRALTSIAHLEMFVPQILVVQIMYGQADRSVIRVVALEVVVQEVHRDAQIREGTTNLAP